MTEECDVQIVPSTPLRTKNSVTDRRQQENQPFGFALSFLRIFRGVLAFISEESSFSPLLRLGFLPPTFHIPTKSNKSCFFQILSNNPKLLESNRTCLNRLGKPYFFERHVHCRLVHSERTLENWVLRDFLCDAIQISMLGTYW